MRRHVVDTLLELAAQDGRVFLLTGDLGYAVLEPFAERHPDRFLNVGVAEQNMVGIAGGLAESGFLPFAYSIAPFAALRPFEAFRNGAAAHGWPVRLLGVGGGFEYGTAGASHHALEDVALMRTLHDVDVFVPADGDQARAMLTAHATSPRPAYYRLGKVDDEHVPGLDGSDTSGLQTIASGRDGLMLCMGPIAREAAAARTRLAAEGLDLGLAVLATLAPAPRDALASLLATAPFVLTVEEHVGAGGLGSLVAEVIAERELGARLVRAHAQGSDGRVGSRAYLRKMHGLDADALVARVHRELSDALHTPTS